MLDRPDLYEKDEQELSDLVKEIKSMQLLRKIPMYQFEDNMLCPTCWDLAYNNKYHHHSKK
jgi:hypothetical protein